MSNDEPTNLDAWVLVDRQKEIDAAVKERARRELARFHKEGPPVDLIKPSDVEDHPAVRPVPIDPKRGPAPMQDAFNCPERWRLPK